MKYRRGGAQAKSAPLVVRPRPSDPRQGVLRLGPHSLPCALGRAGLSACKREGDGATPLARLRVLRGYFRARAAQDMAPLRSGVPMRPVTERLGWCDGVGDRNYNRPVRLPYPASCERMLREDGLYDMCLVLDWNVTQRRQGKGSAIFLHLARPGFQPTEGCIAVSRRVMARLLPVLARGSVLLVRG